MKIYNGENFVSERPARSTARANGPWASRKRKIKQGKPVGRKGGQVTHTGK
jgi:hypothetical protein